MRKQINLPTAYVAIVHQYTTAHTFPPKRLKGTQERCNQRNTKLLVYPRRIIGGMGNTYQLINRSLIALRLTETREVGASILRLDKYPLP